METNKYSLKIENFLREKGLLNKSIEEKKMSHEKAMKLIKENFTKEEMEQLIEAIENL